MIFRAAQVLCLLAVSFYLVVAERDTSPFATTATPSRWANQAKLTLGHYVKQLHSQMDQPKQKKAASAGEQVKARKLRQQKDLSFPAPPPSSQGTSPFSGSIPSPPPAEMYQSFRCCNSTIVMDLHLYSEGEGCAGKPFRSVLITMEPNPGCFPGSTHQLCPMGGTGSLFYRVYGTGTNCTSAEFLDFPFPQCALQEDHDSDDDEDTSSGSNSPESGTDDNDDEGPPECAKDCAGVAEMSYLDMVSMCTLVREWENSSCMDDCNATELVIIAEPMAVCAPRNETDHSMNETECSIPSNSFGRFDPGYIQTMPNEGSVTFTTAFSELSMESMTNQTFLYGFYSSIIFVTASAAGVPINNVTIDSMRDGSLIIDTSVQMPNPKQRAFFRSFLSSSSYPGGTIYSNLTQDYGPSEVVAVVPETGQPIVAPTSQPPTAAPTATNATLAPNVQSPTDNATSAGFDEIIAFIPSSATTAVPQPCGLSILAAATLLGLSVSVLAW